MTMWNGVVTESLLYLYKEYAANHHGVEPDGYDELNYAAMTYNEFVGFIKECLATGREMPDVVP
ncbi:MAG: hypothetical protein K2K53_01050 [Oscillospiraceae bacterium]|nr:hypothetical protein [Oscillospiraceae bacterium]